MAIKIGKPAQLLIGLGGDSAPANILTQNLHIDIYDRYLSYNWPDWNAPSGAYVGVVAGNAESVNAVPMLTFYQMFTLDPNVGDGNLGSLNNATFMNAYWARVKLMFQQVGIYNKPALLHLEPDLWGYVQRHSLTQNIDPLQIPAYVSANPDCGAQPNNIKGIVGCLIAMSRQYAPKAYVGLMPSSWGGNDTAQIVAYMNAIGAASADFIVMETQDRDAGCFEVIPQPSECTRGGSGWYWDASNVSHPNFTDHLAQATAYHNGIGGRPLLWWQTPLGVPSNTPGGTPGHYRDNRVQYFLTHPNELVAAGGFGVVFGGGASNQTGITTDGGQFQSLSTSYRANPTPLN